MESGRRRQGCTPNGRGLRTVRADDET